MNEELMRELNMCKDDTDKKVEKFIEEHHEHGLECGVKIAHIAKELHPDAIAVIPLYRSCIVIKQSNQERDDGVCTIHSYADPHWLGGEIDIDTLKLDKFHVEYYIQGDRQGPIIINKNPIEEERCNLEDDDKIFIENDEN